MKNALEKLLNKNWFLVIIFLGPATLFLFVFKILPILYALIISLSEYEFKFGGFVGLKNYILVFQDAKFGQALLNTFWYVFISIPLTISFSLFFAVLLNLGIKARGFFRTSYFLPYITSMVAAAIVWKAFYHPTNGVINSLLSLIGISPLQWLEEPAGIFEMIFNRGLPAILAGPSLALFSIILFSVWKVMGYQVVILLAGLQNIPAELYEAARIDGANKVQQFFKITLPLLSPTLYFIIITSTIFSFQVFAPIYMMTGQEAGGAPDGTTLVTAFYMYQWAFAPGYNDFGYAAAMAFILFF
ncbi:MAG TPA: sugar ABC transporter permease, partial [Firmicutes bacterium]|nr:sugar ABC transporter permease [Bacillota bacterium]